MSNESEKHAAGLLKIAVRRMAKSYPFHAHLLLPERFVCVPEVGTMGVTIRDARLQFWYAPEFVSHCDFDELIGLLHHEINHVLFGHLLVQSDEFPNQSARIIAEEVTVNEWIVERLPGSPITLEQHPCLPPLEDTATRYARLAKEPAHSGRKPVRSAPKTVPMGRNLVQSGRKTPGAVRKIESSDDKLSLSPLDNHEIWEHAQKNPHVGRLVISTAVRHARDAMSQRDWERISRRVRDQIAVITGDAKSEGVTELIHPERAGSIHWKQLLRGFVTKTLQRRPALHRAPRRFPELIGVVPGSSQSGARHRVMAVIDTSASMSVDMLEQIGGELRHLALHCDVTVVECDCEIQATYPFRGEITGVQGRGGTDFRPPFEADVLQQIRPDVVIYFTDGEGPAPATPPKVPTIWCLTATNAPPVEWGLAVSVAGLRVE